MPLITAALAAMALVATAAGKANNVSPEQVQATAADLAQQWLAILVALATLYGLVIRPAMKRLMAKWEAQVAAIAKKVDRVDHQLHPNGGKSAHDYARRAVEGVERLHAMVDEVREATHHNSKRIDRVQGEMLAQGWRQQELSNQFSRHESAGRVALLHFRDALREQGITLPKAPGEDEEETDR